MINNESLLLLIMYCVGTDDASHTMFSCSRRDAEHRIGNNKIEVRLRAANTILKLQTGEKSHNQALMIRNIIKIKIPKAQNTVV